MKRWSPPRQTAFSLVEVVLALGIFSIAVVSIIASMGSGITAQARAIDDTVQAQIVQSVLGEIRLTDFTVLPDWHNQTLLFDERGLPLIPSEEGRAIYRAKPLVETNVSFLGGPNNPHTARLTVQIYKNSSAAAVANNSAKPVATFGAMIADNGR